MTGTMGYTTTGDLFIVRLNSTGDVMWSNLYEYYALNSSGYSIIQVSDGSFIVAGMTQVGNVYNKDIFLMKVNSAGIKIWSHMYGGAGDDYAQELIQTNDGGFALAASVTDSAGQYNFSLLKTDSLGIPSMTMVYHVLGNDYASSLVETTSGGFIITGQTEVFTSKDILLLGISPSGLPLWEKRIGENFYDDTKSIKRAPGGGYFVSGDFTGSGGGLTDGFLMRINDAGSSGCNEEDLQLPTILSNYSYRDNETVIQPLPLTIMNPQYDFVSGFTKSTLCSNGGVAGNNIQNIKLYPNPNNGMFTLSLNQKIEEGVIEITNLLGEIILQEPVKQELQQQLQIPNAISGIYFLRIRYIEKQYVEKIIVE